MENAFKLLIDKPVASLVILLAVLVPLIMQAPKLQLDASAETLSIEGDMDPAFYTKTQKTFGQNDNLIVSYTSDSHVLTAENIEGIKKLRDELRALSYIESVTTVLDVPLFQSPPLTMMQMKDAHTIENGLANIDMAKEEFKVSPLYSDNLISKDGKTTALLIRLK